MGSIILHKQPETMKVLKDFQDDLTLLNSGWQIALNSNQDIELRSSLLRLIVVWNSSGDKAKVKIKARWTLLGFFLNIILLLLYVFPCILWNLIFVNSKIKRAEQILFKILTEKHSGVSNA